MVYICFLGGSITLCFAYSEIGVLVIDWYTVSFENIFSLKLTKVVHCAKTVKAMNGYCESLWVCLLMPSVQSDTHYLLLDKTTFCPRILVSCFEFKHLQNK